MEIKCAKIFMKLTLVYVSCAVLYENLMTDSV